MSQYGAPSKNPPWVRNSGVPNQQSLQSQMIGPLNTQGLVYQQPPQMFQSPLGIQQSANMMSSINSGVAMSALGASQQQLYGASATVSYPVPRSLNSNAFSGATVNPSAPPVGQTTSPSATPKQRVFTGTVTKVHDNFGFVDEDIFFQMSCCVKGSNPVVGDRVLVEASFNPSMPFKWNATRLQVLPMGSANLPGNLPSLSNSNNISASLANALNIPANNLNNITNNPANNMANNNSGRKGYCGSPNSYNAVPPTMDISNSSGGNNFSRSRVSPRRERPRQPVRDRERERDRDRERERERERDRKEDEERRKRRREERSKEGTKEERASHSTRSPSLQRRRSKSPRNKRRPRPTPRYMVHVPKIALDVPEADVLELRRRYNSLYIPSDFFASNFRWVDAFPPNTPFTLDRSCLFHIMHRDTDQVTENKAVLDPPDADYLFSAKVMLMSMPDMDDFLKKCCQMTEDLDSSEGEGRDFVHPTRLVNFLVGLRGKNETMAIGGPWSKSLDGSDPDKDPQVLIRTAIRNCQALTGIDLSTCTQWYRFLEIYYRRGETTHKGKMVPARVETVVLFLPDVWSCVPTRLEWDALHLNYKRHLDRKLKALLQMESDDEAGIADEKEGEEVSDVTKKEPTHWSRLDPKVMQVPELRQELEARNLASKGLKSQLMARLQKVLKQEQDVELKEKEESGEGDADGDADGDAGGDAAGAGAGSGSATSTSKDPDPEPSDRDNDKDKREDDEKKKQVEKDRSSLEKRYELPEQPHIIVHPNRNAKSGKFDCTTMSLSLLLDYRQDDTKEHSFEVSLFAELFNEMLMRDSGFRIYRALYNNAERLKDEDKERKKKDDNKDKKERDDRDDKKKTDEEKDEKEKDDSKEKEKNGDKTSEGSDKDRRKEEVRDKDEKKEKKKKDKVITTDPMLLLAFVYFDQTHCGYILDKDLEELIYALGLNLSRAQVKRIVSGVLTSQGNARESRENREALYYRRLTDRPLTDRPQTDRPQADRPRTEENKVSTSNNEPEENLEYIAFGNKRLLPVFSHSNGGPPPTKRARRDSQEESQTPQGFVMYKGGLVDVEKLMSQLKRSEKARSDTESTLTQLRDELSDVKKSACSSSNKVNDLSSELSDSKEKLRKALEELASVQARSAGYWSTLKDVHGRLHEVIVKNEEPPSSKCEPMDAEEKPNI